ncbi:imidazolonepropionase [Prevotella sp. E13-27]|uniref:imidazolonepropionase n=1 Tax=Prevotella sp. E13-27 TaxID=2938122 RepID=UPI002009F04D|nr:imidazolonepropionase [Prevotella sp. E13-27]MCK8622842.1 imidazolonepropionase [Prevotella sp. E13-27]
MKKTLIKNIGMLAVDNHGQHCLCGQDMSHIDIVKDAWLLVEDGRFKEWGSMDDDHLDDIVNGDNMREMETLSVDAEGGAVLPSFCDSHTHLVYADSREGEFVDKIRGLSYEEIARRGGGILNSADRLHEMSEEELFEQAMGRIDEITRKGTGAVEIKSGYGLNTSDELKMLRVIKRIKESTRIKVVATFLGAHAVGREYQGRQDEYVDLIINEMIPEVGKQHLAEFIDVFCDRGFFTPDETSRILEAGAKWGMRGKIHGQELADSGGVEVAVRHGALSVDHLESMTDNDISLLKTQTITIPTALPGTSFFLNMPFAPARKIIDAGLPLALASDYNPGSTPSGDMKFIVSLACIKMRLLPEEAINAATINSAAAMDISKDYGSIARGKVANFFITTKMKDLSFLPYSYTSPTIKRVFLRGEEY